MQRNTQSIRLVVKPDLKELVQTQAGKLGVNVSTYIKHLILSDLRESTLRDASDRVRYNVEKSLTDKGVETGGRKASAVLEDLV